MLKRRAFAILVLGFLGACDSGSSNFPDGGPSDGGQGDAPPGDGGGGGPEPVAITARTSRATHSCRVARDRTDHSPRQWGASGHALIATKGGATYLVRRESMPVNPLMPAPATFLVSSFDAAGTFGTASSLGMVDVDGVAAAPRGDGFALVWVQGAKLRFAAFDAAGVAVVPPRDVADVPTGGFSTLTPSMAAGPDGGFGVVYDPETTGNARAVQFLVLTADGAVRTPPRRLDGPAAGMPYVGAAPAISGGPAGYTMVWTDPAEPNGAIDFARADAAGTETVPRKRLARGSSGNQIGRTTWLAFAPMVHGLLELDGTFLVSWVEARVGVSDPSTGGGSGAGSVVRLARVDGTGALLGTPAALRAPEDGIDEAEPTLVRFGDAVAVLWARGHHIYVCGGCVPDHRVDLLLIDPSDLTPLSDVVSISNGGGTQAGGLLRRQVAVKDKTLLMAYRLQFHVHNTPGSATFECDRVK